MKSILFSLLAAMIFSSVSPSRALAVSPMPSEIEKDLEKKSMEKTIPSEADTVCWVRIVYEKNGNGIKEDYFSTVVVQGSPPKAEAFDKAMTFAEDKLKEEHISEVVIECKFPRSKGN